MAWLVRWSVTLLLRWPTVLAGQTGSYTGVDR